MKSRKELVLEYMYRHSYGEEKEQVMFTTDQISEALQLQRTYVSTLLNELIKQQEIEKIKGRPVKYRLHIDMDHNYSEQSFFTSFTGYDNTLKYPIQELKAALVYPKDCRNILLIGEEGVGKSGFAHNAFAYAKERKILSAHGELLMINAYEVKHQELKKKEQAMVEMVTIEHAQLLSMQELQTLFHTIHSSFPQVSLVLVIYTKHSETDQKLTFMQKLFDFTIQIPSIRQYQLSERFHLLCESLHTQSRLLQRHIKIDAVLLKCLLCYAVPGNIAQLFDDIKKGCANGYSRVFHKASKHEVLFLFIKDFPPYVRKGLLEYPKQSEEIMKLLGEEQSFVFDGYQLQTSIQPQQGKKVKVSLTQSMEENTTHLINMGVNDEELSTLMSVDIISWLQRYQEQCAAYVKATPSFSTMIPEGIHRIVSILLEKAEQQLSRAYLQMTYDAICLFLYERVKNKQIDGLIQSHMVDEVAKQCQAEFVLATQAIQELEQVYGKQMREQDVYYVTLLLLNVDSLSNKTRKKPAILIVTHGVGTATSISACIRELSLNNNVYGFDLDLEEDLDTAYNQLKELVLHIDTGRGILMVYDMGSIRTIGKMLMDEVDVNIRMIKIPLQLFLLEAAKKAEQAESVEALQEEITSIAKESFSMLENSYYRQQEKYTIIVLGRVGKSEALQIKGYIEDHIDLRGVTDVVTIISDDKEQLLKEVNQLRKASTILCIVGAYDPQLYHIRYLSFSKLLSIPVDRLMFLLYYEDIPLDEISDAQKRIEAYVDQQFLQQGMKRYVPQIKQVIQEVEKDGYCLSTYIQAELLLYIGFTLVAGVQEKNKAFHRAKNSVISHHKTLYNSLKQHMQRLEEEIGYVLNDHDIANMIELMTRK